MAGEKHLGLTVMQGSCCISLFNGKPLVKKIFFKSFPKKKNPEVTNVKNPELDLIRSIFLECEYFGFVIRFWIRQKNPINFVFGFEDSFSYFPKKFHP